MLHIRGMDAAVSVSLSLTLLWLLIASVALTTADVDAEHEKAKYRREMNEPNRQPDAGGVEYDEGDLVNDMRMFGDIKSLLDSDAVKQFAGTFGKQGMSAETLLSAAGTLLGQNKPKKSDASNKADSIGDTLDMLTKGAEMLSRYFPADPSGGDEDDEVAVEIDEDHDGRRQKRRPNSGNGGGDPLQAILGQVLQSGPMQESLLQMVGGLLSQPSGKPGSRGKSQDDQPNPLAMAASLLSAFGGSGAGAGAGNKKSKDNEPNPLAMAASLLSAFGGGGGGAGGAGGLGALGDLVGAFSNLASPPPPAAGGRKKRDGSASFDQEPIVDMAKQLGSVFASNFLQGLSGQADVGDAGQKVGDVRASMSNKQGGNGKPKKPSNQMDSNPLGMLMTMLPALMGNNNGGGGGGQQDGNPLNLIMTMLPALMGNNAGGGGGGNQMGSILNIIQDFSESDYWKTGKEMFSKVDSHQVEALGKMITQVLGKKAQNGKDKGPMDGLIDSLLGLAMDHFGSAEKQKSEQRASSQKIKQPKGDDYSDGMKPKPPVKKNATATGKSAGNVDALTASPVVDDGSPLSSSSVDNVDLIAEFLAKWADEGKTAKQKVARTTAVSVLRRALVNFAAYGKALDSQRFFMDVTQANFAIRPKIAALLKKYKVDNEFQNILCVIMALLTKSEAFDTALADMKQIAFMLGHERMEKTPLYLASAELLDILDASPTDGFGATASRFRKFLSSTPHADFRSFARFIGRVLDQHMASFKDSEILTLFPPIAAFFNNVHDLEGILGELDYNALCDVFADFFASKDVVDAAEKLLIPANAEKVGTLVGNLVIGKKLDTLLPDLMALFADVSPSEKATSKLMRTMGEVQDIVDRAKALSKEKRAEKPSSAADDENVPATDGEDKSKANGMTLNALREALNHSLADIGEAVKELSTHGISLESLKVQEQFRLFISDFLTKLGMKLTRSDEPNVLRRAAEAAEKITSEVLDNVIVPSTLLDMILRPHEYADPEKLAETTGKVLKSPDIGKLLAMVEEFVSINAVVHTPEDLVTAVIDAIVESELFTAFAALAGVDMTAAAGCADSMAVVKSHLRSYIGDPLLTLVGIYVHSIEDPSCAARWLCDFAGSVHLQVVKDSTAFWMANAHRTGGLVVAGVLSATRPEEALRFETLYQAIIDGKSGKACAKIYHGNCGQERVLDLSGVVNDPVVHRPSGDHQGQQQGEDVGLGESIKVTPVQKPADEVDPADEKETARKEEL